MTGLLHRVMPAIALVAILSIIRDVYGREASVTVAAICAAVATYLLVQDRP